MKGFDELIDGGIPVGNIVILAGHPGVGKTTFCMQFLAQGSQNSGERSLYVSFSENRAKLLKNMSQFGIDVGSMESKGLLRILIHQLGVSNTPVQEIEEISRQMEEFKPNRCVIDSASSLSLFVPGGNRSDIISMLQLLFSKISAHEDCTTIITGEMPSGSDQFGNGIEELISDGVVLLRYRYRGAAKIRTLEVRKMRGTFHWNKQVYMEITQKGVEVDPEIEFN